MKIVLLLCAFCTFVWPQLSEAANILVLEGVPSPSHHIWIRTLTTALAEKGHNITSISADIESKPIPNLHYIHLEQVYDHIYNGSEKIDFLEIGKINRWLAAFVYADFSKKICEGIVKSKGIQVLLEYPNDFKFDLVLHDWLMHPCLLGFLPKFNFPPLISMTAYSGISTTYFLNGNPLTPIVPHVYIDDFEPDFLGRASNLLYFFYESAIRQYYLFPMMDRIANQVFKDVPHPSEYQKKTQLVLLNNNPAVEIIQPLLPNIITVGGMQIKKPKGLPANLQKIADGAKRSLILFSLGTNMRSDMLGEWRLKIIIETFKRLPQYTFLWKFESNDLPIDIPKNVHIQAWMPQSEILAHPNTILFITHAGLLSVQESVWHAVPMLGLPVFGDQFLNIQRMVDIHVAERLDLKHIKKYDLVNKIVKICENPKYQENVKRRSKNFQDQPESPLDRAVWWVEWLIRNKEAEFLESPLKHFGMLANHGIDIIAFILFVELLLLFIFIRIVLRCCRKTKNEKLINKKNN